MPRQFSIRATLLALTYIVLMGLGMAYMYHLRGVAYGAPRMVEVFLPAQIFITGLALYLCFCWFGWRAIGFGRLNAIHLLWLVPFTITISMMGRQSVTGLVSLDAVSWIAIATVAFVTFLVGVGEEVAFRGGLLHGWLARLPVAAAMAISAIGFSLLHAVNVFGGQPIDITLSQMVNTLLLGLFFAPLALLLRSLWPLIVAHFLWDFVLIAGGTAGVNPMNDIAASFYFASTIVLIPVLWFVAIQQSRKGTLHCPPLPLIKA